MSYMFQKQAGRHLEHEPASMNAADGTSVEQNTGTGIAFNNDGSPGSQRCRSRHLRSSPQFAGETSSQPIAFNFGIARRLLRASRRSAARLVGGRHGARTAIRPARSPASRSTRTASRGATSATARRCRSPSSASPRSRNQDWRLNRIGNNYYCLDHGIQAPGRSPRVKQAGNGPDRAEGAEESNVDVSLEITTPGSPPSAVLDQRQDDHGQRRVTLDRCWPRSFSTTRKGMSRDK